MGNPDMIVMDHMPLGMQRTGTMRKLPSGDFAFEPSPGGFIVDDGLPDFDLQMDDDGEIRATRI